MNFPNFSEQHIAIDIETKEDKPLDKYGPGSHRHYLQGEDSYILGVAISDSKNDYYFEASEDLFSWLKEQENNHTWIGHNLLYDLSWLYYEGFRPRKVIDTRGLVKMLDEDRQSYSLDSCASDYLGFRKNEAEIKAFCEKEGLKGSPQKWLWKMPPELVGRYAKIDTRLTYDLWKKLTPEIDRQGLTYIWGIECELLPILADTHHRGLRVDETRRLEASEKLGAEIQELKGWLVQKAGSDFNTNSGKQLAPIFKKLKIPYQLTEKGNPSFKAENLLPYGVEPDMEYFPHVLVSHNKLQKLKRDFVDGMTRFIVDGRIHPTIDPYGTVTGRPTAKTPNVFQIPKKGRGKKICRVLFLPEEGEEWASSDVASEEYRIFAHYAMGPGSDNYREKYNTISGYDMHEENANLAGCDRPKAKTIGLGVLFGMGKKKMAINLGLGETQGAAIVERFHRTNPSFLHTSRQAQKWSQKHGYMRTLSKRRRRFPNGKGAYKSLNFLTQGNSADLAKIIIVELARRGVLEHITFLLWLYDEFNFSVKKENRGHLLHLNELINTALPLKVKMELGLEFGKNWGEVEKSDWKALTL